MARHSGTRRDPRRVGARAQRSRSAPARARATADGTADRTHVRRRRHRDRRVQPARFAMVRVVARWCARWHPRARGGRRSGMRAAVIAAAAHAVHDRGDVDDLPAPRARRIGHHGKGRALHTGRTMGLSAGEVDRRGRSAGRLLARRGCASSPTWLPGAPLARRHRPTTGFREGVGTWRKTALTRTSDRCRASVSTRANS